MQQVKKVEIIISSLEVEEVSEILDKAKVSGYTVIKNALGKGERGFSYADFDEESSNSYVMTVCTNEQQLENLVNLLKPLLKKVGGVCLVTDATWVIH
jgi:nitrogen regulatory protein PII